MKCQGDETHKAPGPVLQFPQPDKMVHAVLVGLDMAVQHGGVGGNASGVDLFGQFQPPVAACLVSAYPAASRLFEYLGPAARATIKPRGNQSIDDLFVGHSADSSQVVQFDHCESFQVHVREVALQLAEEASVIIELKPRMETSNYVEFSSAFIVGLASYFDAFFNAPLIGLWMPDPAIKSAKSAIGY